MKRKSWEISRRTLLGGAGALVALPMLEAMLPSVRRAYAAGAPAPRRFMVFHFPIGMNVSAWMPSGSGTGYTLSSSLQPLAPFKGDVNVLTNLNNDNANDASGPSHTASVATMLTQTQVPRIATGPADGSLRNGISLDQLIAKNLGQYTRIPSVVLGTSNYGGNSNEGFNPTYMVNISWTDKNAPVPKQTDPAAAFNNLFAGVSPTTPDPAAQKRALYRQSVLDYVNHDASGLMNRVGKADQAKLDQYFTSLRDLESRIQSLVPPMACNPGKAPSQPPNLVTRHKLMLDLSVLAFQCDVTRVVAYSFEHTVSEEIKYTFVDPNFPASYHLDVTHHGGDATKLAYYAEADTWFASQLAYLLGKLKAIQESDGTLLDNSLVLFTSELSDGNSHSIHNLPVVLAGSGGKKIQTGRRLDYPSGEKMANLCISIANALGANITTFGGDGTRTLPGL